MGELLFHPEYRNRGLGMQVMHRVADHLLFLGAYRYLACVTVVRSDDHSLRPAGFLPIDRFLARNNFLSLSEAVTELPWLETDGVRRSHFPLHELLDQGFAVMTRQAWPPGKMESGTRPGCPK